jgi:predicted polyphosphate/ATP-dependent NAD kinase
MGGSVGLKGTDGEKMYLKAKDLGAEPVTPGKTKELLSYIKHREAIELLAAPGVMGAQHLEALGIPHRVIGEIGEQTSAEDTQRIARQMAECGAELVIFVGGDGTARDIYDAIGTSIPVVAVPAGVKVFSAAFAVSTRAAAELVDVFLEEDTSFTDEEVLDIDEEAFREDRLASRLYGYLIVPEVRRYLQPGKASSSVGGSSQESKKEIAAYVIEQMDPQVLYLLGPGTTIKVIAEEMGLPKTLLGVDAVSDGKLVGKDLNEKGILQLFEQYKHRQIIVTPIGGNGVIFGRGSKQFTPQVIRQVGKDNILVVGTRDKVNKLDCLRVDTGEVELDEMLSGYCTVWVDYKVAKVLKVRC